MFVSPQNSYTEIPTPSVLALESAPFGRWLDHEGRAPMNGIGTLIKEGLTLFLSSPFSISCALQSCLTLCNPMDYSPPGSSVHGILQARILEWVATSYSRGSSRPTAQTCIFCIGRQILHSLSDQGRGGAEWEEVLGLLSECSISLLRWWSLDS